MVTPQPPGAAGPREWLLRVYQRCEAMPNVDVPTHSLKSGLKDAMAAYDALAAELAELKQHCELYKAAARPYVNELAAKRKDERNALAEQAEMLAAVLESYHKTRLESFTDVVTKALAAWSAFKASNGGAGE